MCALPMKLEACAALLQTALHLEKKSKRHSKSLTPFWSRSSCSRPRQTHPRPQRGGDIPPCRNTSCVNIRSRRPPLASDRAAPPPNTSKRKTPGKSNAEFLRLRSRPSEEQTHGSRTNKLLKMMFKAHVASSQRCNLYIHADFIEL